MKFSHISNQIKKGLQIIIVLATFFLNFGVGGINKAYAVACYTLTIKIKGGGIVTPSPAPDCNSGTQYTDGTVVQLTASPDAKYSFGGWWTIDPSPSDVFIDNANPYSITMNANQSIKAKFPPTNDAFATPVIVNTTLPFNDTVDTTGAADIGDGPAIPSTFVCDPEKPSKPKLKKGLRNVWYSYTADVDKLVVIDTLGSIAPPPPPTISNYDTYIAIWTGSDINSLTFVACDDDTSGTVQSAVKLSVTAGTTYYIEAAQWNGELAAPVEIPSGGTLKLNVRNYVQTFADVPFDHPYFLYIEAMYAAGLTGGCGTATTGQLIYCPSASLNRGQMAVFTLRGQFGSSYTPPPPPYHFKDNWKNISWAESWSNGMLAAGLTGGCATAPKLLYCPETQTTREQAAVFALRLKYGGGYAPPAATGAVFADMTNASYWANPWAEQAYADGLIPSCGTDSVSGKPKFCPNTVVDRGFGAYIIAKAKSLTP